MQKMIHEKRTSTWLAVVSKEWPKIAWRRETILLKNVYSDKVLLFPSCCLFVVSWSLKNVYVQGLTMVDGRIFRASDKILCVLYFNALFWAEILLGQPNSSDGHDITRSTLKKIVSRGIIAYSNISIFLQLYNVSMVIITAFWKPST